MNAGTSRESGLDVAFSGSVCLGHEESGLVQLCLSLDFEEELDHSLKVGLEFGV